MIVGIIGAGTMGSGIAQAFAQCEGFQVCLCDITAELAARGKDRIENQLTKRVQKGKMTADAAQAILVNFTDERTIHPATLRMLFRGNLGRTCLVSGETAFAGLPNGTYEIERHRVTKTLNRAVFENGHDAGRAMGLSVLCKLIMSTSGVPLPLLFRSMTEIPARVLGVFDQVGSIETGKRADLVMMDFHDYEVTHVFLSGKQVF